MSAPRANLHKYDNKVTVDHRNEVSPTRTGGRH